MLRPPKAERIRVIGRNQRKDITANSAKDAKKT